MSLIICTYQTPSRNKAEGARDMKAPAVLDLYNIMQDLAQHFRVYNVFGDYFNVLLPMAFTSLSSRPVLLHRYSLPLVCRW